MRTTLILGLAAVAALLLASSPEPLDLVVAAAAGGAAAWLWGAISWMALPWHHACFRRFEDEEGLVRALDRTAPTTGLYGYPAPPRYEPGMTREQRAAADADVLDRMRRGPLVFAVVTRHGFPPIGKPMAGAFLLAAFVALLFAWMLRQTVGLDVLARALFVGVGGLAGASLARLPDWNWHGFPARYTAVLVADAAIGWFLVGLVLAWLA
jgi:hypothetical protein